MCRESKIQFCDNYLIMLNLTLEALKGRAGKADLPAEGDTARVPWVSFLCPYPRLGAGEAGNLEPPTDVDKPPTDAALPGKGPGKGPTRGTGRDKAPRAARPEGVPRPPAT